MPTASVGGRQGAGLSQAPGKDMGPQGKHCGRLDAEAGPGSVPMEVHWGGTTLHRAMGGPEAGTGDKPPGDRRPKGPRADRHREALPCSTSARPGH